MNLNEKSEIMAGVIRNLIVPMQQLGGRCKFYITVGGKECSVGVEPDGTFEVNVPDEGDGEVISGRIVVEIDS